VNEGKQGEFLSRPTTEILGQNSTESYQTFLANRPAYCDETVHCLFFTKMLIRQWKIYF